MRGVLAPIQGAVLEGVEPGVVGARAPRPRVKFWNPFGIFIEWVLEMVGGGGVMFRWTPRRGVPAFFDGAGVRDGGWRWVK